MFPRCPQGGIVIGSCRSLSKSAVQLFDLGKGCTQRRTGRPFVDFSALRHDRLVTPMVQQPLEVLRRLYLQWFQKFSLTADLKPPWSISSRVCTMLCLRGKRKMHVGYLFANTLSASQNESFLREGKDSVLLKRTRLLVRELSTSIKSLQYDLRKTDMVKSVNRKLLFDTHAIVRLLEESGFSTQQSEAIVSVMVTTTNANMDTMYADMVTKTQQEIMLQRVMSSIASVKKDMIILEKSEFSALLAENEKVKIELLQLKMQLADVMNKVRADTMLDMNAEKSRVKQMKAEHEKKLLEARNEMLEMNGENGRHVTQVNMKIDTEVAGLKTMLESHKLDTIKYLAGSVFTCLTVVLGFYRIWM
ncbi:mitochondrial calcium uniporter regulator 1 [Clupea harengus]|uniref:Mitochondrial calcium uniporter regulator 1 n=1 Tax=Clupea harengus TaxID=7950 RepID=A0A6P3VFE2_CLUHA|nr:mitochondrial calcium uniporter regulator 1 [Clupea harengus]